VLTYYAQKVSGIIKPFPSINRNKPTTSARVSEKGGEKVVKLGEQESNERDTYVRKSSHCHHQGGYHHGLGLKLDRTKGVVNTRGKI